MGPLVIHRGPAPAPTPTACFRPGRFCWILTGKRVCAQPLQSCLTLCDPVDCSPPGSSLHGHPQARILELVSMPSSRGPFQPRDPTCIFYISCIGRQVLYHKCYLGSPWRTMQIKIYSLPRSMMDRQPTHIA